MDTFDIFELKEGNQFGLLPGQYQTNDLDCSLHVFSIDENNTIHGKIGAGSYGVDELNLINASAYNTTLDKDGRLEIYGPCSGPDELYGEYYLEIVNSKIISIMVYDKPYYHIDSGVMPESSYGKAAKNNLEHELKVPPVANLFSVENVDEMAVIKSRIKYYQDQGVVFENRSVYELLKNEKIWFLYAGSFGEVSSYYVTLEKALDMIVPAVDEDKFSMSELSIGLNLDLLKHNIKCDEVYTPVEDTAKLSLNDKLLKLKANGVIFHDAELQLTMKSNPVWTVTFNGFTLGKYYETLENTVDRIFTLVNTKCFNYADLNVVCDLPGCVRYLNKSTINEQN